MLRQFSLGSLLPGVGDSLRVTTLRHHLGTLAGGLEESGTADRLRPLRQTPSRPFMPSLQRELPSQAPMPYRELEGVRALATAAAAPMATARGRSSRATAAPVTSGAPS
eukprot:13708420-Alexandrium_andersonii.AAC.1